MLNFESVKNTILITLIIVLGFSLLNKCGETKYYNQVLSSQKDSTLIYKNKFGLSEAKVTSIQLEREEFKSALNDSIKVLRRLRGVLGVKTATTLLSSSATKIIYDTIKYPKLPVGYKLAPAIYPIYKSSVKTLWYSIETTANKDSIHNKVQFKNELVMTNEQKFGLFREKPINITITQMNPYTSNSEVNYYTMKSRRSALDLEIGVGVAYDIFRQRFVPAALTLAIGKKIPI